MNQGGTPPRKHLRFSTRRPVRRDPSLIMANKGEASPAGFKYHFQIRTDMKYRCPLCGYIYDEEKEGVKFADLPDDWCCPICGEPKSEFVAVE